MAISFYGAIGLTGGTTGYLDDIEGSFLNNNDCAVVFDVANSKFYFYLLDADSGLSASSPDIISPVNNAGNKRWILIEGSSTVGLLATAAEWTAQQNFNEAAITSTSNATAWNLDSAQTAVHTLTENTTISAPTNMNAGGTYVLRVVQAAGVYTLAWNAAFDWGAASTPAAPAADGDVVVFSFYSDGTTMYGVEAVRVEA
jgi:hypothetical protein